jgi:hypothetical protein
MNENDRPWLAGETVIYCNGFGEPRSVLTVDRVTKSGRAVCGDRRFNEYGDTHNGSMERGATRGTIRRPEYPNEPADVTDRMDRDRLCKSIKAGLYHFSPRDYTTDGLRAIAAALILYRSKEGAENG